MTQIGIMIEGQDGLNWDRWDAILTTAEHAGFQSVFRSDHFTNAQGDVKDALELWTSLTYAAQNTTKIEFGPLVTPITFRHPSFIAQYAAAVDTLSDGRLVLGMGTGWQDREHKAFGIHFPELSERYERLEDGLEIVTKLLTNNEPTTYEGKHFSIEDAIITFKRETPTKMLIGGNGPNKTLPLAAKYAGEWNAVYLDRETFKQRNELLDGYLEEEGRKPEDVKRSLMTRVLFGRTEDELAAKMESISSTKDELKERGIIVGVGDEVLEQISAWVEAGCERFMLQWIETDDMEGMAALGEVLIPEFHK